MFEDVAMPHVTELVAGFGWRSCGEIELRDDACHISRIGLDRIFPRWAFVRFRGPGNSGENQFARLHVSLRVERLSIQNLKLNQMDMDGMNIAGGVGERPDLHGSGLRIFCDGVIP